MLKEVILGTVGVVAVAAIVYAIVKYQKTKEENDENVERIYVDELNLGEIKSWFTDKMDSETKKGVIFYPTKENNERWKIKVSENPNQIVQIVYDTSNDNVIAYREVAFAEMSDKLKTLLNDNGGTLIIDK